jgi:polar amino acid transport system substrate-binding protein
MFGNNSLIRAGILVMVMALLLPMTVSAQTLERIQSTGTFNIGYVSDQAPFSFKSPDNEPVGYAIELGQNVTDALKGKIGLANLAVNFTPTTLEEGLKMAADGRIDMLCGAVSDTLKRRETVSFSIPIFITGTAVLVRKDAPPDLVRVLKGEQAYSGPVWRGSINRALAKHTYAVHAGTVTEQYVRDRIKTLGVIATIVTVDDHAKGVELVEKKKADAYFADRVILESYAAGSTKYTDMMIIDRYFSYEPIALVMARNNDDFRLIVDTTLSKLYSSGEILKIFKRYLGDPGNMADMLFKIHARY